MLSTQRQSEIMRMVRAQKTCAIGELAEALGVSDETIRRYVKPLIAEGLVLKVHGGIVLPGHLDEPPFQQRILENREAKQAIAALLGTLIKDGDTLIIDGGTTCVHVAHALCQHSRLTVVTNSAEVARILAPRNGNRVFITGGELRQDDASAFGEAALSFIRQFRVRYAIVSVSSVTVDGAFMYTQLCDAEFSRTALEQAEQRVVVADHAKFGRNALVRAFGPDSVDLLVTDTAPAPALMQAFAQANLEVSWGSPAHSQSDPRPSLSPLVEEHLSGLG
jgi:DeoR family transcriptional regulator, glycerol-3-phosphate regulon repressor